jgi:Asp-tRNA(Asn)/Glu-tRNA(Gln) amidotransferase B subunit
MSINLDEYLTSTHSIAYNFLAKSFRNDPLHYVDALVKGDDDCASILHSMRNPNDTVKDFHPIFVMVNKLYLNELVPVLSVHEPIQKSELIRVLHTEQLGLGRSLLAVALLLHSEIITYNQARQLLQLVSTPEYVGVFIEDFVYTTPILDAQDLNFVQEAIDSFLTHQPAYITQYAEGKTKVIGSMVGQVIKQLRESNPLYKPDPKTINEMAIATLEKLK